MADGGLGAPHGPSVEDRDGARRYGAPRLGRPGEGEKTETAPVRRRFCPGQWHTPYTGGRLLVSGPPAALAVAPVPPPLPATRGCSASQPSGPPRLDGDSPSGREQSDGREGGGGPSRLPTNRSTQWRVAVPLTACAPARAACGPDPGGVPGGTATRRRRMPPRSDQREGGGVAHKPGRRGPKGYDSVPCAKSHRCGRGGA